MDKSLIPEIAKTELRSILNESGCIFYSSHETLCKGDIYIMGYNPGGRGGPNILKSIDEMLTNTENAYIDGDWENGNGQFKGNAPLQKRIKYVVELMGYNLSEVCASNLIFVQSQDAKKVDVKLADICWPVHKAIIELIRPKLILVFGNSGLSPFMFLHQKFGGEIEYQDGGHGNWQLKAFETNIDEKPVYVVGLPHLSRYKPEGKEGVDNWIKTKHQYAMNIR